MFNRLLHLLILPTLILIVGCSPVDESPDIVNPPDDISLSSTDSEAVGIALEPIAEGIEDPVAFAAPNDGSGRLFVASRQGSIYIIKDGERLDQPFLEIEGRTNSRGPEEGLLGLAFHPDYAENGMFFINYTNGLNQTLISRFLVDPDNPDLAQPYSEQIILRIDQPATNHNGGNLAFGPDGYLYIGMGDGGKWGDMFGNGQNGQTLLAAMLRLDVDEGDSYSIPPDNPFLDDPDTLDEIWAIGLRNPWRYSFDRLTGDLYIGDVGQGDYEEISFQSAESKGGENYGWSIMEGQHCYPENESCSEDGLILPIVEYGHGPECSVTGGYVYRGEAIPSLYGVYIFGDFCSGRIWGLSSNGEGEWQIIDLLDTVMLISSFGEDAEGELYVLDISEGIVYQIVEP